MWTQGRANLNLVEENDRAVSLDRNRRVGGFLARKAKATRLVTLWKGGQYGTTLTQGFVRGPEEIQRKMCYNGQVVHRGEGWGWGRARDVNTIGDQEFTSIDCRSSFRTGGVVRC